jgi:hypothetical protein
MDEWVARFKSRDDMAEEYTALLLRVPDDSGIWPVLNLAIIDRWSESGLDYIKRKAWGSQ